MKTPVTVTKQGDGMGYTVRSDGEVQDVDLSKSDAQALARRLRKKIGLGKRNPGKAVRLRNFSGTITRKANGTVQIKGRAKRT